MTVILNTGYGYTFVVNSDKIITVGDMYGFFERVIIIMTVITLTSIDDTICI